jgi:type IV pilus assembly protein PilA
MKRLHSKKGFTLIELMIVILIIAILVAIAVPVYLAATNSAKKRTCQSNLRTIDSAINAYNGYYDKMPGNGTALATLGPTWLKRDPTCPSSAAPATYSLAGGDTVNGVPPATACPGNPAGTTVAGHFI